MGRIVPAGFSKRTNKPYPSFFKCGSCGYREQYGTQNAPQQAPYQQNRPPQDWNPSTSTPAFLVGQMNNLADRITKLEDKVYGVKEVPVESLPVTDLPPLEDIIF